MEFQVYSCPTKKVDQIKGPTCLSIMMYHVLLTPDWKLVTFATPVSVLNSDRGDFLGITTG